MTPNPIEAYKQNLASSQESSEELVLKYLPLVKYVVGRLGVSLPYFLDREDLIEVGVIGLINASRSYDPSKGASFKTYAYTNIKGAIYDELRRLDIIPRGQREKLRSLERIRERLSGELGRPPTFHELAQEMEISSDDLDDLLVCARTSQLMSLDAGEEGGGSLVDSLAASSGTNPVAAAEARELRAVLAEAIGALPDAERTVVILYFKEGLLLREIGQVIGVSESRISQLLSRATQLLNQALKVKTS